MAPIVSVCVITYQHKDFIAQCLESILMQKTSFPFEIILGEDESIDGTREICIQYADKYPQQIRLFLRNRQDVICVNGRPTGRYNFIENLKAAQGKYIALCDGDDYWTDPHKLQKQVDFLENNPRYSMSFHNASIIDKRGKILKESFLGPKTKKDRNFKDVFLGQMQTATVIFRSHLIKELPKEFYKVSNADRFLCALLALHGDAKYIDDIKPSMHRIHSGGIWSSQSQVNKENCTIQTLKTLQTVVPVENKEIVNYYLTLRFYKITSTYIRHSYSLKKIFSSYLKGVRANLRSEKKIKALIAGHKEIAKSFHTNKKKNAMFLGNTFQ